MEARSATSLRGAAVTTSVVSSVAQLGQADSACKGPAALVTDGRFRGSGLVSQLRTALGTHGDAASVLSRSRWATLDDAQAVRDAMGAAQTVVAVGGGSVLDCVKLALALEDEDTATAITVAQRGGWVYVDGAPRRRRLIAVPTTLGTSSEVSPIVSFVHRGDKRAVTSPHLPADIAVLDPSCTAGLSRTQVLEGALEALMRAAGPYVGDRVDRPMQDATALGLVRAIAASVGQLGQSCEPTGPSARLVLAQLSQRTQDPALVAERPPFGATWWFVANNTAHHLGVRKMTALLWVVPRMWALMPSLPASGSVRHRDLVWAAIRNEIPVGLPETPAEGFAALVAWLGLPILPNPTPAQAQDIARSCIRMWGGGLPMLAGLPYAQLAALLTTNPLADSPAPGDPTPRRPAAVGTNQH